MTHTLGKAVSEAERRKGRYLTLRELEELHQDGSSRQLTAEELRAVKRIWPGMQLKFKLEAHSG